MAPQIIFGTANFGMEGGSNSNSGFLDTSSVRDILRTLQRLGINRLDTGARYPPLNPGQSERLIGEAGEGANGEFLVDTKVYTDTKTDGSGDLEREKMGVSVKGSLERLRRKGGVNVLYAHRADPSTPLEEQIQNFAEQIALGHCKTWGVSNTPPATLEKILQLCEQNDWPKPTYYQGTYNIISRGMETKLWPILRAHGIHFVAFWAIASGFLTGNLVNGNHAGTRLADDNPLGKAFQRMYGAEEVMQAVKTFDKETRGLGLTPLEVALRWIFHHSKLTDDDCVLLGASKAAQIIENVALIRKGPLPEDVLPLVDELWESVKATRGEII